MNYEKLTEIDKSIEHLNRLISIIDSSFFLEIIFTKSDYIPADCFGNRGIDLGTTEIRISETNKENMYWGWRDFYLPKDSFRSSIKGKIQEEIDYLKKEKEGILNKKWYQFWI